MNKGTAPQLSESERKLLTRLVFISFLLFSVFIIGLGYLATTSEPTMSYSL